MPPTAARLRPIYISVFDDFDRSAAKFWNYGNRFIHEQVVLMCRRAALLTISNLTAAKEFSTEVMSIRPEYRSQPPRGGA